MAKTASKKVAVAGSKSSFVDKLECVWLFLSALAHAHGIIPFLFHDLLADPNYNGPIKASYRLYGAVDGRYLNGDILIVILQGMAAIFGTPLCLYLIYCIVSKKWYRHFIQILLCVIQSYGTIAFFLESHVQNHQYISSVPIDFWLTFVALNALWIVIPFAMIGQSVAWMKKRAFGKLE